MALVCMKSNQLCEKTSAIEFFLVFGQFHHVFYFTTIFAHLQAVSLSNKILCNFQQ